MKACILLGRGIKAVEEMPYAWHRTEDSNGHYLPLPE